ncbi:cell division protein FtsQ/DivIB [Falsihalocynthiibacter sp. SS001]|uniref:cell division protein FtsQ/DivIB n=1 Tax=Falsihalocynthiibacter sp. SS001 TaxID=3349698 RepID=UPI0036D4141B
MSKVVSARPVAGLSQRHTSQAKRDPAPSRVAYRVHRLWLTPTFRKIVRYGVPILLVSFLTGGILASADRRQAIIDVAAEVRRDLEEHPVFAIHMMAIDGASTDLSEDIREVVPLDFPISSFDLDLKQIHSMISELDAVASVDVQLRVGGVLQVTVQERLPVVVWRGTRAVELLDAEGHRVIKVPARASRPDLPLVTGLGADRAIPEALDLFASTGPIKGRVRGLVRVGERRWDLVLNNDQRILLPEEKPREALHRVIALNSVRDLLARDIEVVDMRLNDRPTLRLRNTPENSTDDPSVIESGVQQP